MTRFYYPFFALLIFTIITSCGSDSPGATSDVDQVTDRPAGAFDDVAAAMDGEAGTQEARQLLLENYARISDPTTGRVDPAASQQYITLATRLADDADGDTLAALPLYKAAEVYQALGDYQGAAGVFERIHDDYPEFSKSGEALFMLAFTYDENLRDYDRARELYERFLEENPDHTFADDTEMLLKNLGKTDEEMLQSLGADN